MAKKKKALDVQKFGGVEELGKVKMQEGLDEKGVDYELSHIEEQSKTTLEADVGHGDAVVIRRFTFGMNPVAFREGRPDKQQLFNYHSKGIEIALWRDGLKVVPEINPRIVINEKEMVYDIFVTAKVARGHLLNAAPQTLTQITNG